MALIDIVAESGSNGVMSVERGDIGEIVDICVESQNVIELILVASGGGDGDFVYIS